MKLCYRVFIKWLIVLALLVIFIWGVIAYFRQQSASRIVSFDMQATIHQFVRQIDAQPHLSSARKRQEVNAFSHAMITAVKQYAITHHVTIILSQTVVSGAPDRTRIIQEKISVMIHALKN